ncbi:uncharacterized protein [Dysidea avara]|uniref:uncharacterized protein n=1 Tax=Dysidea avara TaxID=196820 RepID=UPI003331F42C
MMRDSNEAVKQFRWETIFLEFKAKLPTLVALVKFILPHVSKTLLYFVIGVIIKSRSPHMALVQRAVSVMLYANGANKQVYKCLQPLMVCLSHKRTIALVNRLSEDHDVEVLFWADELKKYIEERSFNYETIGNIDIGQCEDSAAEFSPSRSSVLSRQVSANSSVVDHSFTDGSVADGSGESQESESFWPASDTSHIEMDTSLTFNEYSYIQPDTSISELDVFYIAPAYSPVRSPNDEHSLPGQPVTIDHVARANEDTVGQQTPVNTNEGATAGDVVTVQSNAWSGFKITIDNVDKNFHPSFQRIHHQTKLLHCVHMYAAKDRIDLSLYSNAPPQNVAITPEDILPSLNDLCSIKEHFKVLVSRILVQQMEKFSTQKKDVLWHIPFLYSEEMSMKSTVVPLGVINLNENKIDEMARIMDQIHRYVPTQTNNVTITFADSEETLTYTEYNFHPICCSGDQLTAAREHTAQSVRHHSENELDRLEGLVPVVDDWHTNITLRIHFLL